MTTKAYTAINNIGEPEPGTTIKPRSFLRVLAIVAVLALIVVGMVAINSSSGQLHNKLRLSSSLHATKLHLRSPFSFMSRAPNYYVYLGYNFQGKTVEDCIDRVWHLCNNVDEDMYLCGLVRTNVACGVPQDVGFACSDYMDPYYPALLSKFKTCVQQKGVNLNAPLIVDTTLHLQN